MRGSLLKSMCVCIYIYICITYGLCRLAPLWARISLNNPFSNPLENPYITPLETVIHIALGWQPDPQVREQLPILSHSDLVDGDFRD